MHDLTDFERDLLVAIDRRDAPSGVALRDELRTSADTVIHDPRLYSTLDGLVTKGLVEKDQQDGRTNAYTLTQLGRRAIADQTRRPSETGTD